MGRHDMACRRGTNTDGGDETRNGCLHHVQRTATGAGSVQQGLTRSLELDARRLDRTRTNTPLPRSMPGSSWFDTFLQQAPYPRPEHGCALCPLLWHGDRHRLPTSFHLHLDTGPKETAGYTPLLVSCRYEIDVVNDISSHISYHPQMSVNSITCRKKDILLHGLALNCKSRQGAWFTGRSGTAACRPFRAGVPGELESASSAAPLESTSPTLLS